LAWSVSAQRSAAGDRTAGSNLQAGANAAWDADLFGARQSAVDASVAGLLALEARLGEVQGALASSIALNYITLRGTQARLVIAQQNLDSQLETLQITRWRNQAGLIGAIEVEQAFVACELTRSQLPPLETGKQKALHALAVQVGKQPAALRDIVGSSAVVPSAVSGVGLGSPADALHQRADLRAARHLVEQAQANVALAQAQRYPALNFGASLGAGAASLEALSSVGAVVATAMMSLAGSLVDGGAANARIQAQQAVRAQAQANYQAVNLTVLQEAEDAIVALRSDQLRLLQLQQVAAAAGRAAALARQRFTSGLVDFQIVLDTQRSQLAAQDNLALANATVSSDQVRLYGALGGGWQPGLATIPAKTTPSP
jgi:NodT family efflux transporter outer membrane factor (OMF) lipoprotein